MSQTSAMSLVEAVTNVIVGWLVALATQVVVFPVMGLQATVAQNLVLSATFASVSLLRSYLLRRLFTRYAREGT